MKKIDELKANLEELKVEAQTLLNANNVVDAKAKMEEVKAVKEAIALQEQLDLEEIEEVKNKVEKVEKKMENKEVKNKQVELFANYVRGTVTEAERKELEREVISNKMQEGTKADGGALVPFDEDCSIIALREADDALQNLVTVKPVTTLAGKKTIRIRKTGGSNFVQVGEGNPIGTKTTPSYKELEYSCKKYAAIYDITNEFVDDSAEDIAKEMNLWIGSDSRELRNALIIAELSKKTAVAIANSDDLKKVKNVTLNTANAKYASILTNQDGFNYLDTLKDAHGNYLLQPVVSEAGKYTFDGMDINVKDNSILPTVEGKAPIFIGDFKMAVILFDRKKVAVKATQEGGDAFENDLTLLRAIERNDVQTLDAEAFVHGQITIGSAAKSK